MKNLHISLNLDLSDQNVRNEDLLEKLQGKDDWVEINLSDNPIENIQYLTLQKNLKVLNLTGTNIKDIDILFYFQTLEELYLSDTQVSDIRPIIHMNKLRKLYLTSTYVDDISPLKNLITLEELSLSNTKISKDLNFLRGLVNLTQLYLTEVELDYLSLLQLKPLKNLKVLEINYEPELIYTKQELFKEFRNYRQIDDLIQI
jgi:internalin A